MRATFFFLLVFLCLCVGGCADEGILLSEQVIESGILEEGVVTDVPPEVWEAMKRNYRYFPRAPVEVFEAEQRAFYTKYIDAEGITILSHAEVADTYLIEARQVVLTMTLEYPALRDRLRFQHGFYMILCEFDPVTGANPALPEFANGGFRQTCLTTYSNLGGGGVNGFCIAAVAHKYYGALRSFAHEFAHALDSEMERLSPGFLDRLRQAYQAALKAGTWKGLYAKTASSEYWAEGVEVWFYDIGAGRAFETYKAFFERDPLLAESLDEWFPRVSF